MGGCMQCMYRNTNFRLPRINPPAVLMRSNAPRFHGRGVFVVRAPSRGCSLSVDPFSPRCGAQVCCLNFLCTYKSGAPSPSSLWLLVSSHILIFTDFILSRVQCNMLRATP